MIVADSNLIASCVLESTATESARNLLSADSEWYVPRLWRYEVTNILATMIKAKRLSAELATSVFAALVESLKAYEREPMPDDVFSLVSEHGITGYDAQFVALARELHCPLYTQDRNFSISFLIAQNPITGSGRVEASCHNAAVQRLLVVRQMAQTPILSRA